MANRTKCPKCGLLFVEPVGPVNASILLIGEFPNYDDIRSGCVGTGRVGDILRRELAQIGVQLSACRFINLWQHAKSKECDVSLHLDKIIPELAGHDWVVLMGSEITRALTGYGIMEVAGLKVKAKMFPKIKMFAIPNAGTLLHGDIGEMRLALEKFDKVRRKK